MRAAFCVGPRWFLLALSLLGITLPPSRDYFVIQMYFPHIPQEYFFPDSNLRVNSYFFHLPPSFPLSICSSFLPFFFPSYFLEHDLSHACYVPLALWLQKDNRYLLVGVPQNAFLPPPWTAFRNIPWSQMWWLSRVIPASPA